jgi:hypothetical protein
MIDKCDADCGRMPTFIKEIKEDQRKDRSKEIYRIILRENVSIVIG